LEIGSSSAIASFTINEGPVFMDAVITAGSNKTADDDDSSASTDPCALITAVTNKGHLYIYSHQLETFETTKLKKTIKSVIKYKL